MDGDVGVNKLSPDLAKVPERFRADLRELNRLDTATLWNVAQTDLDAAEVAQYEGLLVKKSTGDITDRGTSAT